MACGRNGQELGQPFDDAHHGGFDQQCNIQLTFPKSWPDYA
jgi:hypothetical protein